MAAGLFRFIGSVGRSVVVSNSFGTFGIMIIFVMGGFVLSGGTER